MTHSIDRTEQQIRADLAIVADTCRAVVACVHGVSVRMQQAATARLLRDVEMMLERRTP